MTSRPRSFFRFVLIGLGLPCLMVPFGVSYQALRITGAPQTYTSNAGLTVTSDSGDIITADQIGHLVTQIEAPELKLRSAERQRALRPETPACEVAIQTDPHRLRRIIGLSATGTEPRYVRQYLDAFLDQISALHVTENSPSPQPRPEVQLKIESRASAAVENVVPWKPAILLGAGAAFLLGLIPVLIGGLIWVLTGPKTKIPPPIPVQAP